MMTRITFLYIAINLLCFNLISSGSKIIAIVISAACILGILTIGISHGAIDNLLYKTETKKRAGLSFYLRYIAIIIAVVVIWAFAPNIAFILFLIASAYHFGQSQFVHYFQRNNKLAPYLYFSWGFLILMLSFWLNYAEIQTLVNDYLENVFVLNQLAKYGGIFSLCFGLITLACLIYAVKCKAIKLSILFYELYIIGLIALSFYVLPLLVGFALYFIILHSLKVMREEYEFCKNELSVNSFLQFVKLLFPLTLISIVGVVLLFSALLYFSKESWIPYALLIALSCITIPHSFVMDNFYKTEIPSKLPLS